ncbi:hypothetical protein EZ428_07430 [Pedobacter frigiditerrae]|uniref:Lipoprotein n=1 Tax=Pedobacter frigiditerrae TaxID=2530452 RepID=A0A4R0MWJ3_9SPHI|nr:hypothetical protein [Pedobacter frigiditerrae]TCC91588.1 hypothetical protein EZ428_07430 [Pedobacter frigiditerrae]
MKNICYLMLLTIFLAACKKVNSTAGVTLSLTNNSKENFKSLTVNIRGQIFEFNNLAPSKTETISVKDTYRYFYAKVVTATDEIVAQPIDFVGEQLIKSGKVDVNLEIKTINGTRYLDIIAQ